MRLERLELEGFGRLSDLAIDLAPRATVIVGDNEAGKSTVVRAVRAALYGLDAGGQGRAVERSEWNRWMPWSNGSYGLVLTWSLDSGRRFRIARKFDQRGSTAQVQEIGGGDVTAAMRVGRTVAPGLLHLGIDEIVFSATAWLGEEGLKLPSDPAKRRIATTRLQEAIERLADTGQGVTAPEAVSRLREAAARIGSERRMSTPLGMASSRLRTLEHQLLEAARRHDAVTSDRARLDQLESSAAEARDRSLACERAWLRGRLARIARERAEIAATAAELRQVGAELDATESFRAFPLEDETRVIALGGEMHQAATAAAEARARVDAATPRLEEVRRRRVEIAEGLAALGPPPAAEDRHIQEAHAIQGELGAESGVEQRLEDGRRNSAYGEQLHRQIAATGLAGLPGGAAPVLRPMFDRAMTRSRVPLLAGAAMAAFGILAAVGVAGGSSPAAVAGLVGAIVGAAAVGVTLLRDDGARARRELVQQCPGIDTTAEGLEIAASRLPTLHRLQEELQRCQILVEADRAEIEAARGRSAALASRAEGLAAELGLPPADVSHPPSEPNSIGHFTSRTEAALATVAAAIERQHCHDRLGADDASLAQEQDSLEATLEESAHRHRQLEAVECRLRALLDLTQTGTDLAWNAAVAVHRESCELRRRHDTAAARCLQLRRRLEAFGTDEATLARRDTAYAHELVVRGGDPEEARAAEAPAGATLDALEREVDAARRRAETATAEAEKLRARLAGTEENLPCVADLVDERTSCAAARERNLRQLAALDRAIEMINEATRDVHCDLAPRLAESVGQRLSLIAEGRYRDVNVDTDRLEVSLLSHERSEVIPLELVSRGTRDQVSLLLRLSLAELLSGSGETVPLVLDEPLLSADRHRTENALEFLCRLSEHHQVVMTTSDRGVATTVHEHLGRDCALVELPSAVARPHAQQPASRWSGDLGRPVG